MHANMGPVHTEGTVRFLGAGIRMQWAVRMGNGGQCVSWDHGGWILHCEGDET